VKKCPVCKIDIMVFYGSPDSAGVEHYYTTCPLCKTVLDFQKSEWGESVSYKNNKVK
jgi:hypothetical protein